MESPATTPSAGPNVQPPHGLPSHPQPRSPRNPPVVGANGGAGQGARHRRGGGGGGGGHTQRNHPQPPADPRRVLVTGFPPFVQPQDLRHAFAAIGDPTVEILNDKAACLLFSTDQQATEAIQLNNKAIVYGEFVTVREYRGAGGGAGAGPSLSAVDGAATATPRPNNKPINKREFPRSKEKDGGIVSPEHLDLSGEFCSQLDGLLAAVRLTEHEAAGLAALYADVQAALCQYMPGCVAMPFGSITTGLGIKTSDADCFVQLPPQQRHLAHNIVNKAKRILQQHPKVFAELLCIPRANTPIVKFHHLPTNTNCDLSFKTPLGYRNSTLIAHLLHADPRLVPLAVTVKYWAKVHQLTGTGRLSNYALTMCIIFYLQQLHILPSVASLQTDRQHDIAVDHWNTGFDTRPIPRSDNTAPLSDLIGGFYAFYATFDFDQYVVCPYLGQPIKRDLFKDLNTLPAEYAIYVDNVRNELVYPMRTLTALCVQDPIELSHNVASAVSARLASDIKAYLAFAADAYRKHQPAGCRDLLPSILLHKPTITRPKQHPEYRINLPPRVIAAIPGDWRDTVRHVVKHIFEQLLLMPLTVHQSKHSATNGNETDGAAAAPSPAPAPSRAPNPKRARERYRACVTAPVWKRKQFNNLYNHVQMEFSRKQRRITEEIVHVNKAALNLPYSLSISYTGAKHAIVSVRNHEGEPEVFREFGRFLMSSLSGWFVTLLQTHLGEQPRDQTDARRAADGDGSVTDTRTADTTLNNAHDASLAVADDQPDDDDDSDDSTDEDSGDDSNHTASDPPSQAMAKVTVTKQTGDDITNSNSNSICTNAEEQLTL